MRMVTSWCLIEDREKLLATVGFTLDMRTCSKVCGHILNNLRTCSMSFAQFDCLNSEACFVLHLHYMGFSVIFYFWGGRRPSYQNHTFTHKSLGSSFDFATCVIQFLIESNKFTHSPPSNFVQVMRFWHCRTLVELRAFSVSTGSTKCASF